MIREAGRPKIWDFAYVAAVIMIPTSHANSDLNQRLFPSLVHKTAGQRLEKRLILSCLYIPCCCSCHCSLFTLPQQREPSFPYTTRRYRVLATPIRLPIRSDQLHHLRKAGKTFGVGFKHSGFPSAFGSAISRPFYFTLNRSEE
jgi:hypothetical protein